MFFTEPTALHSVRRPSRAGPYLFVEKIAGQFNRIGWALTFA